MQRYGQAHMVANQAAMSVFACRRVDPEALDYKPSRPKRVWKWVSDDVWWQIVELVRDEPERSALAWLEPQGWLQRHRRDALRIVGA